jgi:hypothetical protein
LFRLGTKHSLGRLRIASDRSQTVDRRVESIYREELTMMGMCASSRESVARGAHDRIEASGQADAAGRCRASL